MREIRFEVSGRPRPKARPRVSNGRAYTPKATKQYQEAVGWMARATLNLDENRDWPVNGRYELVLKYRMANDRSAPDGDNVLKAVQDALEGIAYANDRQVVRALHHRLPNGTPVTQVMLRVLSDKPLPTGMEPVLPAAERAVARAMDICKEGKRSGWTEADMSEFWKVVAERAGLFVD